MNNFRSGVMRRMRKYTYDMERNYRKRNTELEKIKKYIGSPYYTSRVEEIDNEIEKGKIRIVEEAQKDLMVALADMRKAVGTRMTAPPTVEMVNALNILGMLDTITPTQLQVYAETMADCPLAMQRLSQIAAKNEMRIVTIHPDQMMLAVDIIEGNLVTFLSGFRGNNEQCPPSVKMLYPYFRAEEYYSGSEGESAEKVDQRFLDKIVGFGTPELFDNPAEAGVKPKVQYFFESFDGLLQFIHAKTDNVEDKYKEIDNILAQCPDSYGAAYRYYKSTGKKLDVIN